jgi:hypothetical protein
MRAASRGERCRKRSVGEVVHVAVGEVGREEERQVDLRQRQPVGQPRHLLGLQRHARRPERGRVAEGSGLPGHERDSGLFRGGNRVGVHAGALGIEPVDDDGPEGDAHAILEGVRGVDQLVDRYLLGQGDEHDRAPFRIGQHLQHVGLVLIGLTVTAPSKPRADSSR